MNHIETQRDFETDAVIVKGYVRWQSGDITRFETVVVPRSWAKHLSPVEIIEARNSAADHFREAMQKAMDVFVAEAKARGAVPRKIAL